MASGDQHQEEPINVRLRHKVHLSADLRLEPRRYQRELCETALRENVVIYLGTGLGKTFIIVMFLNSPQTAERIQSKQKIVFLAPTQDLIKQQAEYINRQVPYRVKIFCGRTARCGEHIDHWDERAWNDELDKVDLLFMTPQIFAAAVSTSLIGWDRIYAVIFDEIHHASKSKKSGHQYLHILLSLSSYINFSHQRSVSAPRLIGLTASLINRMPKRREDISAEIRHLESIMRARCITDIKVQDMKPAQVIHQFTSFSITPDNDALAKIFSDFEAELNTVLKSQKAEKLRERKSALLSDEQTKLLAFHNRLRLAAAGFSIKPGSFPKIFKGLNCIRQRCGLWALRAICHRLIEALNKHALNSCVPQEMKPLYLNFAQILKTTYDALDRFLGPSNEKALLNYSRPKSRALLDILENEYKRTKDGTNGKSNFSCIIFVRSRLEVVALTEWIQQVSRVLPQYSFIRCDYALGLAATMSSKYSCITKRKATEQSAMLDKFRKGYLNVILTTSVLEEGIDLPVCSTVIRYDAPNNFREYVQSRGRARQNISSLIVMSENTLTFDIQEKLDIYHDFERTIKNTLSGSSVTLTAVQSAQFQPKRPEDMDDFLLTNEGKVRISSTTAKVILNMYCNRLSQSVPFAESIRYDRIEEPVGKFKTVLYLPSGSPLDNGIVGDVKNCEEHADNSAIIAAIRALQNAGELDACGVPTRVSEANVDELLDTKDLAPKFDALDPDLEGTRSKENANLFLFKPKLFEIGNYLSRNIRERKYSLFKIRFVPDQNNCRRETCDFFTIPAFGIMVDSSISSDFIPAQLYSHYGLMKVEFELISDSVNINETRDHNDLLNFTHRMLTRCLLLRFIRREEFKQHCLFYAVPLNHEGRPDCGKIRSAFAGAFGEIGVGDIVKVRHIGRQSEGRRPENNQLLLVRAIRDDLRPTDKIPRRNVTFLDQFRYDFGDDRFVGTRSRIIEVMNISKDFGSIKEGKKMRREYSTESIFYLEQLLEPFEQDAALVFQAYNLPEIIHKLYLHSVASNLDTRFVQETLKHRDVVAPNLEPSREIPIEEVWTGTDSCELPNVAHEYENEHDEVFEENDELKHAEDSEGDDDDESASDVDSLDSLGSSADFSDSELLVGPQYKDMISKRILDLEDRDDEDLKPWKMSEYKESDLVRTETIPSFSRSHYSSEAEAQIAPIFFQLQMELSPLQHQLVDKLEGLEFKFTNDSAFLDEDVEFKKRIAVVDSSIVPPIIFDRSKPLKEASRPKLVLEAITLSRAQETYNLECNENVGDSFLKYLISVVLFKCLDGNEGFLTSARSRLTSNKCFCYLAKKAELSKSAITRPFSKDQLEFLLGRNTNEADLNRMRPKDLADTFESLVGSYLLHRGEFEAILAIDWLGLKVIREEIFDEFHSDTVVFSRIPTALFDSDNQEMKLFYISCKKKFRRFENIIGYEFNDPSYLIQAFTHASSSAKCTRSYQRLEFLGDAILDYLTTMTLVRTASMDDPGQITSSRSALVNNCAFAKLAIKYKYDLFIQHANHELYDELTKVCIAIEEDPEMAFLDIIDYDRVSKLLADVFESVAGAIYLDSGCSLDKVWSIYYPIMKDSIDREIANPTKNVLQMLYETFPGKGRIVFESYDVKIEDGNMTGVSCRVVGFGEFEGIGRTRKQAKLRAAIKAMESPPSAEVKEKLDKEYYAKYPSPSTTARQSGGGNRNRNRSFQPNRQQQSSSYSQRGYNRQKYFKPM